MPELRSTPAEDMDVATLESLQQLLLAQAQECFWQKAVMDGYKDASIAKLAARVSDLYSSAGDWGIKSEAISSEWIHHMTAKHHHFAAAAQYRQACECLEKRRYGEEVARLRDSLLCVNEALKEARYINKMVLEDLTGLKNKVQDDLQRAEKDNDLIYLSKFWEITIACLLIILRCCPPKIRAQNTRASKHGCCQSSQGSLRTLGFPWRQ